MPRSTKPRPVRALPHPYASALRQLLAALLVAALVGVLLLVGIAMAIRRQLSVDVNDPPAVALWVGVAAASLVFLAAMVGILRSARLHMYLRRASRPPSASRRRRPTDRMTERLLEDIDAADLGLGDVRFRVVVVDRGAFAVAFMTPDYLIDRTPDIAPLRLGERGRKALGRIGWLEHERRTIGADGDWQYNGTEYTGPGADLADNPGIPLSAGKVAVLLTSGDEAVAGPVRELLTRARTYA